MVLRIPVGRKWTLTAYLLQVSRQECDHCHLGYLELGIARRDAEVEGQFLTSFFRAGDAPQRAVGQLEEKIGAITQPIRGQYRRCPSCRRGDSMARRSTVESERIAMAAGAAVAGVLVLALVVAAQLAPWVGLILAGLAAVAGAFVFAALNDRKEPKSTDPWPVNRVIPDAMTIPAFMDRVRAVGLGEATRSWARQAKLYDPKVELTRGHVVIVLPPYGLAPPVPNAGARPVTSPPAGAVPPSRTGTSAPTPAAVPVSGQSETGRPELGVEADTMLCPRCAETIKRAATMCRFCQLDLTPS